MGKLSRTKGAAFERVVADLLRPVFPMARRRAMQARGGHEGADIDLTREYHFECAHGQAPSPHAKWEQAQGDASKRAYPFKVAIPVAVTKRNRGEVLATLRLTDLLRLIQCDMKAADGQEP